jgi:fumarylacetoacetase
MDSTHDPALRSFVPVPADGHFSIQNLPYGVFRRAGQPAVHIGAAIGDQVMDLTILEEAGLLESPAFRGQRVFSETTLNALMALGRPAWHEARALISGLLREDEPALRDNAELRARALVPIADAEMLLPAAIGDYTDFYSSREHAHNVGSMFRGPDKALMPNWLHLPVAYHGRASSVVVSGTDLHRPRGQVKPEDSPASLFRPSQAVDFELEVGAFIGPGNELGRPIPIEAAGEHLFGLVLVNDWSARDIQQWEYVPLGPFLAKNFGTSMSPWVVTMEALEPFRIEGPIQEPTPLPYLQSRGAWAIDMHLEAWLQGEKMGRPQRIAESNFKFLYWNLCQQLAHHTVNGCNLRPGDLIASGTISGANPDSYGSLLELSWRGQRPLTFPDGETRSFIEDNDRITMTGWCQGDGYRVGFGTVTGKILPALVT